MKQGLDWWRQDDDADFAAMSPNKVNAWYPDSTPWSADEVYAWDAPKEAETGPFGPGWLVSNKAHTRWYVWWNGI